MKIKITSDSTCDLTKEQLTANNISLFALNVIKNGESFRDNVTITPAEIFEHVAAGGSLCTTAAGSPGEYMDLFAQYAKEYDYIVHLSLGSGFSASYQNACMGASEFDNVHVIDSNNLSTGHGLVVLKACQLAETCTDIQQLCAEINAYAQKVEASFLLNQLKYMVKGGRCSSVAALGANLLGLKPCIEVKDGKMGVVKKYRGNFTKCLTNYIRERLEGRDDIDPSIIFITHTPVEGISLDSIVDTVRSCCDAETIVISTAGCTISCHCGPETLGVLFARK